jgi:hypothetical protein
LLFCVSRKPNPSHFASPSNAEQRPIKIRNISKCNLVFDIFVSVMKRAFKYGKKEILKIEWETCI